MRVTMKTRYCTPQRTVQPGRSVELPEEEATKLVHAGYAVAGQAPVSRNLRESAPKKRPSKGAQGKGAQSKTADKTAAGSGNAPAGGAGSGSGS